VSPDAKLVHFDRASVDQAGGEDAEPLDVVEFFLGERFEGFLEAQGGEVERRPLILP
jgi:hypothetical protein